MPGFTKTTRSLLLTSFGFKILQQPRRMATTSDSGDEWKRRSIVSSFIMKSDNGTPRVALFRRSDKVSTYQ